MLGQIEIRKKIVDPRKAHNINDYHAAVTEWEHNIDKLKAYGGELPHPQDILASYTKLLDDNSGAYAFDKIADAGHVGQYAGDAPEDFLRQLRRQVESRVAQWQRIGPKAQIAGLIPGGLGNEPAPNLPLGGLDLENENAEPIEEQKNAIVTMALDALRTRKGKGKGSKGYGKGYGKSKGGGIGSGKGVKGTAKGQSGYPLSNYGKGKCFTCGEEGH